MAAPVRIGYSVADGAGASIYGVTLTPDASIAAGDWMIAVVSWINNGDSEVAVSGWTKLAPISTTGTMHTTLYSRKFIAGETSYQFHTNSSNTLYAASLQWFRGASDTGWVIGQTGTRAQAIDDFTTVAPSITTTSTDNLVLSFFTERTLADESDILGMNGASKWYFKAQNGASTNTVTAGYSVRAIAGTTPEVTVVYPNTQGSNGSAIQIGLPSTSSVPAPTASFTHLENYLSVSLNASLSSDSNGSIQSYEWNFGEGNIGTGELISHTYTVSGTYSITLTVTDNDGIQSTNTQKVTVTAPPNNLPTPSFTTSMSDMTVTVNASASSDSDGVINTYLWDFGDNTSAIDVIASHTYTVAGSHTITLTVIDDDNAVNTTTRNVTAVAPANVVSVLGNSANRVLSSNTITLTPTNTVNNGDWMIALITYHESPLGSITAPAGWSVLKNHWTAGGIYSQMFVKQFVTGEVNYTFTLNAAHPVAGSLTWFANAADKSLWTIGAHQIRSAGTSDYENVAPAITTTTANNYILTISLERTNASESGIVSATNTTQMFYAGQVANNQPATTIFLGAGFKAVPGTTQPVVVTYPNVQGTNGIGMQIGIPPIGTTANVPPVASFTSSITDYAVSFNAAASYDNDGTIASYNWDFGDSSIGSGITPSHTYTAPGTYPVSLTVTDNTGLTGVAAQQIGIASIATMPTRVGFVWVNANPTSPATINLTPDGSIAAGDWMIAIVTSVNGPTGTHLPPVGWTQISTTINVGTFTSTMWRKKRAVGDTSYGFAMPTGAATMTASLQWFRGASDNGWVIGSIGTRAGSGGTFTTNAPSITTVSTNNLVMTFAGERTTATETDVSSVSNATKWYFTNQTTGYTNSIFVGYHEQTAPGATSAVSIVYPNTQANNGWARQISLPPAASNIPPSANFSVGINYLGINLDASESFDSDGSIVSYEWNFGDSSTATGMTQTHNYAAAGTYTITLTVTDNIGTMGITTRSVSVLAPPPVPKLYVWNSITEVPATASIYNGTNEVATTGLLALAPPNYTISDLFSTTPFYIGHRGSGQVWPEHTLEAYIGAMEAGAKAIELSVHRTSDGVWVCHHDTTTTRMTGQTYTIQNTPYATIAGLTNNASQSFLGSSSSTPPIPRLSDVLDALWGKVVVFVECKSGTPANIDEMFGTVLPARSDYLNRAVSKSHQTNTYASTKPRTLGYKAWVYTNQTITPSELAEMAGRADYIGIPTYPSSGSAMADSDVPAIVATGKPVIGWEMWYKYQTTKYLSLGLQGFMSSALPYSSRGPRRTRDNFASGKRMAGEFHYQGGLAPTFAGGAMIMPNQISAQLMGSMYLPVPSGYAIDFEMQWSTVAGDNTQHHGIAFGKDDDTRYKFGVVPESPGYHLILRRSGSLQLYRHTTDSAVGTSLSASVTTAAISSTSTWAHIRIEVTATTITFQRLDDGSNATIVTNSMHRGKFFWLCQNNTVDRIKFRNVIVSLL